MLLSDEAKKREQDNVDNASANNKLQNADLRHAHNALLRFRGGWRRRNAINHTVFYERLIVAFGTRRTAYRAE
jgi:hypothetical protein